MLKKSISIAKNSKQNIYITNDKTKSQQSIERKVNQELRARREKGENNIKKKYINSILTILFIEESFESGIDEIDDSESEENINNEQNDENKSSLSSVYTTPEKTKVLPKKRIMKSNHHLLIIKKLKPTHQKQVLHQIRK